MAIQKGEVVQHRSGTGPKMLVKRLIGDSDDMASKIADSALKHSGYKDGDAICEWFDEKNNVKTHAFSIDSLKKVE